MKKTSGLHCSNVVMPRIDERLTRYGENLHFSNQKLTRIELNPVKHLQVLDIAVFSRGVVNVLDRVHKSLISLGYFLTCPGVFCPPLQGDGGTGKMIACRNRSRQVVAFGLAVSS